MSGTNFCSASSKRARVSTRWLRNSNPDFVRWRSTSAASAGTSSRSRIRRVMGARIEEYAAPQDSLRWSGSQESGPLARACPRQHVGVLYVNAARPTRERRPRRRRDAHGNSHVMPFITELSMATKLVGALLVAALVGYRRVGAQASTNGEPTQTAVFEPLFADPKEPQFFATYLWTRSTRLASRLGNVGVGETIRRGR